MQKIGLNVGSGQRPFKTTDDVQWINVDCNPDWTPDLLCSGDKLPFDACYVDYVVLHHVLEHFGCGEAQGLIQESWRVLKHHGSLIVCVPDMKALVMGWMGNRISTQIFMTNVYGAYMGHEEDRHKWGFDQYSLNQELLTIGWSSVRKFDFRAIPGADIARDWWILSMECEK